MGTLHRLLISSLILGGCHAKFKKHAPMIDEVHTTVFNSGGAYIFLGQPEEEDLTGTIVGIVQAVKGASIAKDIAEAVDPEDVNATFAAKLAEDLGAGPPFSVVDEERGSLLEVEVVSWGMSVPEIGIQGTFDYNVRVRVFMPDGKRVYTHTEHCSVPVGDPKSLSQALGTVNNKKQVDDMSRKAIQAAFDDAASGCAAVIVSKMRRHAS